MANAKKQMMKQLLLTMLGMALIAASLKADEAVELRWADLIPEGFTAASLTEQLDLGQYDLSGLSDDDPEAQRLYNDMVQLYANAPVVERYDDVVIRIPGFVVPLELDEDRVLSFLLVPYFGACIHTPPPPSNQIVYVETDGQFQAPALDDPVVVTGRLRVEHQQSELGSAGYTLEAATMESFL
ncbi:MAG: DUF3299 domain-containing protein [Saccharospirillum sp.]